MIDGVIYERLHSKLISRNKIESSMTKIPLKILGQESPNDFETQNSSTYSRLNQSKLLNQEAMAKMERAWLINPEKFNPMRNVMEKERIKRTEFMIEHHVKSISGSQCIDLGCGFGYISRFLRDKGAIVTAIDIASNALKNLASFDMQQISISQAALPFLQSKQFQDSSYDLVIATDVIAEMPLSEHRLCMSEFSRLIKKDGIVICSTPLDIDSENALERFIALFKTEFNIVDQRLSYHRLFIKFCRIFNWIKPLKNWLKQSRRTLLILEKVCKFLWPESGVSHVILVGKRRSLLEDTAQLDDHNQQVTSKRKERKWE